MKEDLEGINVHLSCEQNIHLSTKKAAQSWMFTLTTRVSLYAFCMVFHVRWIFWNPTRVACEDSEIWRRVVRKSLSHGKPYK